jgi:hypothetical protein
MQMSSDLSFRWKLCQLTPSNSKAVVEAIQDVGDAVKGFVNSDDHGMKPHDLVELISWAPPSLSDMHEYSPQPADLAANQIACINRLGAGTYRNACSLELVANSMSWLVKYPFDSDTDRKNNR